MLVNYLSWNGSCNTPSTRRMFGGSKPICPAIYTMPFDATPCKRSVLYDQLATTMSTFYGSTSARPVACSSTHGSNTWLYGPMQAGAH